MDIGITGQKGFLGRHVSARLKTDKNISIAGFDHPELDLMDKSQVDKFVSGKDVIIHLAALNRAEDADIMRVNLVGTLNLVQAIRKLNPKCRLVFASSFQVYGKSSEKDIIEEKFATLPLSIYGFSKKFGEELISSHLDNYAILRISNIYGPGCRPFYNSVIATFIQLAKDGKTLTINGSGDQSRDFVFVDDVAEGFSLAAASKQSGTFNVCTGEPVSLNQIVALLKKDFPKLNVERVPAAEEKIFVKGSFEKAKKLLKWSPRVRFEEGLRKCE
jgi:nucleoside-diphosphate-sugar epimerase